MSQTAEEKLVELAKAYARHRKALRNNSQAFRDLRDANPDCDLDLKSIRQEYIDDEREAGNPGMVVLWHGWQYAVDTVLGNRDADYEPEGDAPIRQAARLMDERKEISAQGARIRNRLRIIGDQLLRAEP